MMLFYSQIKREFGPSAWKQGQTSFRENRVKGVKLSGDTVSGEVSDANGTTYNTSLVMARGTIKRSKCGCPPHNPDEGHCQHVAALGIWIIEKGSLLRSGISDADEGVGEMDDSDDEESKVNIVRADPATYVRAIFESGVLKGLIAEPCLRYRDPGSGAIKTSTFAYLRKTYQPSVWQLSGSLMLKVDNTIPRELPYVRTIEGTKVTFTGPEAVETLAAILVHEYRDRIVLDKTADVRLDPDPIRLVSVNVGARIGKQRILSYEFRNSNVHFTSKELSLLAKHGRLSNRNVWKNDSIYTFDPPLALLSSYANKSGLPSYDEESDDKEALNGFDTLHDDSDRPLHPLTVYRLLLELGVSDFTVDSEWKEFHDWRANFEKSKIPVLPRIEYGFSLRDYQRNGLSWLWSLYHRGLSALLADDMGLGKTHQALAFLSSIYRSKKDRPELPSLVVAPTSVVAAWVQKLQKYKTGLKWHVFHGKSRSLPPPGSQLVLTTYGVLQREADLREMDWQVTVLDEAQAIKNASTISSRASRILKAKFRIAMTGTPLENQPTDLWSLMEFLIPGYLGSITRFKRLYGSRHDTTSPYQAQALKRLLSPFLMRRTKTQVLTELPEKTEEILQCEMTPAQAKTYQMYLHSEEADKARANLESGRKIDYAGILALLTRLKQVCDHPKLPMMASKKSRKFKGLNPADSGKWEAFEQLVNEALRSDLKVVVFTQYLGIMDLIGNWLSQNGVGYTDLRGDTSDRSARLKKFAEDPDCKVFICSLLAGGLGIDLTSASVCIHFDRWWNPAREDQATDRLHRIGQTRGVQVFKLQIPGTVEDRIARIIESKKNLSGALIEESPLGLKAFSREELLQLLTASGREVLPEEESAE